MTWGTEVDDPTATTLGRQGSASGEAVTINLEEVAAIKVAVWDDTSDPQTIILSSLGEVYAFPVDNEVGPVLVLSKDRPGAYNKKSDGKITNINDDGAFFIASTDAGSIFTWGPTSAASGLGRSGPNHIPGKVMYAKWRSLLLSLSFFFSLVRS
jgi:hypothetical protein